MADETGISWTDATFNPWLGCEKVSPACAHCYAETFAENRMGLRGEKSVWGADAARRITSPSTWAKPLAWNRQSVERGRKLFGGHDDERIRVFCASMADVFEERADLEEPRRRLFDLIEETPALDWLILTKRPEVARSWLYDFYNRRGWSREWTTRDGLGWGVLPNIWIGTSIENARFTWRADVLREIPATVRFISAEPLLGSLFVPSFGAVSRRGEARTVQPPSRDGIPLSGREPGSGIEAGQVPSELATARGRSSLDLTGIDWLIIGGESGGRGSRPMRPEWARELRDAALDQGIALHFKQWGSYGPDPDALDADAIRYYGPTPKAGGKLLDGIEYCSFPDLAVFA